MPSIRKNNCRRAPKPARTGILGASARRSLATAITAGAAMYRRSPSPAMCGRRWPGEAGSDEGGATTRAFGDEATRRRISYAWMLTAQLSTTAAAAPPSSVTLRVPPSPAEREKGAPDVGELHPAISKQFRGFRLRFVERRLRVGVADQHGVDGGSQYVLDFGVLRNARPVVAVAVLERGVEHRQEREQFQQVGIGDDALANVAASAELGH